MSYVKKDDRRRLELFKQWAEEGEGDNSILASDVPLVLVDNPAFARGKAVRAPAATRSPRVKRTTAKAPARKKPSSRAKPGPRRK